jgi:hypothetical protein
MAGSRADHGRQVMIGALRRPELMIDGAFEVARGAAAAG